MGRTMANAGYVPFVQEVEDKEALKSFLDGRNHYSYMENIDDPVPGIIIRHAENYTKK
jgi:hypothetical protein